MPERRRKMRAALSALVVCLATCIGSLTAFSVPAQARVLGGLWLPPAYLAWRVGGFPSGLTPKLNALQGVERAVVVAGDEAWMVRSIRKGGVVVDDPPAPFNIPIDAFAVHPADYAPFISGTYRDVVTRALRRGHGVLGRASAKLRRLHVGDRMVFVGGTHVIVGAIVPNEVASWSELLVSRAVGTSMRVHHDRFALLQMKGTPPSRRLAAKVHRLVGAGGYPIRVVRPGHARFRKQADSTWPQVLMKVGFGDFAARPAPGRPGYLQMSGAFAHQHLAMRTVPLLGRTTCNVKVFPALIAAMNDLRRRGLAGLIHGFAGCYNARTINRIPTAPISHHSWGAAVDINAAQNPYGARPHQDPRLVAVMARHGFTWGGLWLVPDGMHFEYEVPGIAP